MKTLKITVISILFAFTLQAQEQSDLTIFLSFLKYAGAEKIIEMKKGEQIAAIARFFINTPYEGGTLEADGPEILQVNLREFDCTTLVENVLALDLTLNAPSQDFETFKSKLEFIRYRDGLLNGYPSRLHYTTDWIFNNKKKGLIKVVSTGSKSIHFPLNVGYMSTHPALYPALKSHPDFVGLMAVQENRINRLSFKYLQKGNVDKVYDRIKTGDIIAITTSIPGLDFSHLGFAIVDEKGNVHFLHASSSAKKVILTEEPLFDYLASVKRHTGIVVLRPL